VLLVGDAAGIVSPLTAGGIHTALDSGWRAAHAIADHLDSAGPDPARALAAGYPRFVWKRALRGVADLPLPDWLFNALLGTNAARRIAGAIYFHRRPSEPGAEGDTASGRERSAARTEQVPGAGSQ
jgi:2-polyprenyl-6-methoxyphenol hydroxylase-like FAD-dependent oxidoreductase